VSTHRTTPHTAVALIGLATALVLTACADGGSTNDRSSAASGSTSSSSASASTHNDADVGFAQQMTAHHQQAIDMADLAATRASNTQVEELAARIKAAQGPEMETMTGWLDAWGAGASMSGMDHDMGNMPGSMSSDEMNRLMGLSGSEFDREFLTLMISHHQGAVDMARTEQADGTNPDAVALARQIIADQTAQIGEMQSLLPQV